MSQLNSITDAQLDDLTHAVGAALNKQGISLDAIDLTTLNDELSSFLNGHLGIEIETSKAKVTDGPENNVIQVAFDVTGATVHQVVEIVEPYYDEEKIIEGLKAGTMVTTMGHDGNPSSIDITATGETVALILSQEVDGDYEDFR